MNGKAISMDMLVRCKRLMQPMVNSLGLNRIVSPLYRQLLAWRYRGDELATATQNGRTWKLHPEVALRGEMEEFDTIQWLREVVKPGNCVIDVGANVGQMTMEAAALTGPSGKLVAMEPAPGNYRVLKLHLEANGFAHQVEALQMACGAGRGEVTLNVYGDTKDAIGSGHNILKQTNGDLNTSKVTVPLISLDELCAEKNLKPDVIKIDVEGAELDVIKGAMQVLRQYQPQVQIGFHPFAFSDVKAATEEMRLAFLSCGYEVPPANAQGQYELEEYRMKPKQAR